MIKKENLYLQISFGKTLQTLKVTADKKEYGYDKNGVFKYKAVTCNDKYVEVVTSGRDNDDSTTNRKIVITIGSYNNGCRYTDNHT